MSAWLYSYASSMAFTFHRSLEKPRNGSMQHFIHAAHTYLKSDEVRSRLDVITTPSSYLSLPFKNLLVHVSNASWCNTTNMILTPSNCMIVEIIRPDLQTTWSDVVKTTRTQNPQIHKSYNVHFTHQLVLFYSCFARSISIPIPVSFISSIPSPPIHPLPLKSEPQKLIYRIIETLSTTSPLPSSLLSIQTPTHPSIHPPSKPLDSLSQENKPSIRLISPSINHRLARTTSHQNASNPES